MMNSYFTQTKSKVIIFALALIFSFCLSAEQTHLLLQSDKQTGVLSVQDKKFIPVLNFTNYLHASATGKIIYRAAEKSSWQCAQVSLQGQMDLLEVPSQLTDQDVYPSLSSDGTKLFWAKNGDVKSTLYVWDFARKSVLVSKEIDGYVYLPSWSPDGTKLAFYLKEKSPIPTRDDYGFAVFDWQNDKVQQFPVSMRTRISPQRDSRPKWNNDSKYVSYEARYKDSRKNDSQILVDTTTGKYYSCRIGIWINASEMIFSPPANDSMNLYLNRLIDVLNDKINVNHPMGKVNTPFFEATVFDDKSDTLFFQSGNWVVSAYYLKEKKEDIITEIGFKIREISILHQ